MYELKCTFETEEELRRFLGVRTHPEALNVRETYSEPSRDPRGKNKPWTEYELSLLADWYQKGYRYKKIAASLTRTTAGVAVQLNKMFNKGMKKRSNRPINVSSPIEE